MKIWLDDLRPAPEGWIWTTEIEQVIELLLHQHPQDPITDMSLDHDLGLNQQNELRKTGYDLCKWMAENNCWPTKSVVVHSMNPVGRARMFGVIERYFLGIEEPVY